MSLGFNNSSALLDSYSQRRNYKKCMGFFKIECCTHLSASESWKCIWLQFISTIVCECRQRHCVCSTCLCGCSREILTSHKHGFLYCECMDGVEIYFNSCTVSFVLSGWQILLNDYNRGTYGVNSTHTASKRTVNHTQLQMVRSG